MKTIPQFQTTDLLHLELISMFKNLRFSAEGVLYNFYQHTRHNTDKKTLAIQLKYI